MCRRAKLTQHRLERLGGVRVVDHHGERLPQIHSLHAPGNTVERVDAAHCIVEAGARGHRAGQRGQRVAGVESPREPELRAGRTPGRACDEAHTARVDLDVLRHEIRRHGRIGAVCQPRGDGNRREHGEREVIRGVEHRNAVIVLRDPTQQQFLRREVCITSAVQIEML